MTNHELSQLRWLEKELASDIHHLKELRRADAASKDLADLEETIQAKRAQRRCELNRLRRYIDSVEDTQVRFIMTLRYIKGDSWAKVAASVGGGNTAETVRKRCMRYLQKN